MNALLTKRWVMLLIGFLALITILPLLLLCAYNFPSGDDFFVFSDARANGGIGLAKHYYFNWSGRYASFGLQGLIYGQSNWLFLYQLLPPFVLLLLFFGLNTYLRWQWRKVLSWKGTLSLSLLAMVYVLANAADLATGIFWMATNVQYIGATALALAVFTLFQKALLENGKKQVRLLIFTALSGALIIGFNELTAYYLLGFIFLQLVIFKPFDKKYLGAWITLGFLGLCFLAMVLAPGNAVRSDLEITFKGLVAAVGGGVFMASFFALERLLTTPLLIFTLLIFGLAQSTDVTDKWWQNVRLKPWMVFALFLAFYAGTFIFLFIGTGPNSVVDRARNVICIFFDLGFILTFLYGSFLLKKSNWAFHLSKGIQLLLLLFLVGHFFTGYQIQLTRSESEPDPMAHQSVWNVIQTESYVTTAYLDLLSGKARIYDEVNQERLQILREKNSGKLPLHSNPPTSIFVQDLHHPYGNARQFVETFNPNFKREGFVPTGPIIPPKPKF